MCLSVCPSWLYQITKATCAAYDGIPGVTPLGKGSLNNVLIVIELPLTTIASRKRNSIPISTQRASTSRYRSVIAQTFYPKQFPYIARASSIEQEIVQDSEGRVRYRAEVEELCLVRLA